MSDDHEQRITDLERQIKAFSNAMNVQGILQWRTERNLAELTEDVRGLTEDVRGLTQDMELLANKVDALADHHAATESALQGLIPQIDRFLRGQTGNGH